MRGLCGPDMWVHRRRSIRASGRLVARWGAVPGRLVWGPFVSWGGLLNGCFGVSVDPAGATRWVLDTPTWWSTLPVRLV